MTVAAAVLVGAGIAAVTLVQFVAPPWSLSAMWLVAAGSVVGGVVDQFHAQAAFGASAVLTLAVLMMVTDAVLRCPAFALAQATMATWPLLALTAFAAVVSAMVNNIPVYLVMRSVLQSRGAPRWQLLHLEHACALGGLLTPIGTSSHFVANDVLADLGVAPVSVMDMVPITAPAAVAGFLASLAACRLTGPGGQLAASETVSSLHTQSPSSSWILAALLAWVVASLQPDVIRAIGQWGVTACLLACLLLFGAVNRQAPWEWVRPSTLAFTALPITLGLAVEGSGLGGTIVNAVESGASGWTSTWWIVGGTTAALTQIVHNSVLVSTLLPAVVGLRLGEDRQTALVTSVMALAATSLLLPTGYPLNELVLRDMGETSPRVLLVPALSVVACVTVTMWLSAWAAS